MHIYEGGDSSTTQEHLEKNGKRKFEQKLFKEKDVCTVAYITTVVGCACTTFTQS